jgi:hypothetical protein
MKPDLLLARAPELTVEIAANGATTAIVGGRAVHCGPHGLEILAALTAPRTADDVVREVGAKAKSATTFMAVTAMLQHMLSEGVVRDANAPDAPLGGAPNRGYEHPDIHIEMLNDAPRTDAFLAGIREVVKPGDVVVDIGTGTGVLAIAAAKAGAYRVYAIEASRIADAADLVVRANDLPSVVRVVRGWSTQVELPERADVLVTEMIGNEPFAEDALLINWDARKRLLKEGARVVPRGLRMYAYPARVSATVRAQTFFTEEVTRAWTKRYGMDFSALLALPRPTYVESSARDVATWEALAEPALVGEVDFATCGTTLDLRTRGTITRAGALDALVAYFDLDLAPGISISTAPTVAEASNHWRTPVWLLPAAVEAQAGWAFEIRYRQAKPHGDLTFALL